MSSLLSDCLWGMGFFYFSMVGAFFLSFVYINMRAEMNYFQIFFIALIFPFIWVKDGIIHSFVYWDKKQTT